MDLEVQVEIADGDSLKNLYGQINYSFVDKESLSKMAGVYRNLLVLGLVVYVACMLVSLGESAAIWDRNNNEGNMRNGHKNRIEEIDGERALRSRRGLEGHGANPQNTGRQNKPGHRIEELDADRALRNRRGLPQAIVDGDNQSKHGRLYILENIIFSTCI